MRGLLFALMCVATSIAGAQEVRDNIGVLTCTLSGSRDAQAAQPPASSGDSRNLSCVFKPDGGGAEETYVGLIRVVGGTDALSGKQVLIWVVMGPSKKTRAPGALAQTYVGEAAPPGTAARILVGERDPLFGLAPMTNSAAPRGGEAVTVIELRVHAVPA